MMKIGNLDIDKLYLGSSDDVKVYLGSTKIYPSTPPTKQWVYYAEGDELTHGTVYGIRVDASTVPSEDPVEVYFSDGQTTYSLVYHNGEWMDESLNPIAEEDGYYTLEFPNGVSVGTDYAPFDLELSEVNE